MKTKDMIRQLEDLKEHCKDYMDDTEDCPWNRDVQAIDEAIKRLNTPTDRCLANEILILAGLILGGVGIISVVCGVIYILMGNYPAAWALLPWAITAAIAALLSFAGGAEMMTYDEALRALESIAQNIPNRPSCLCCGYEHNCDRDGCALLEGVKAVMEQLHKDCFGDCTCCAHSGVPYDKPPCADCFDTRNNYHTRNWQWRGVQKETQGNGEAD
ncbi:MAG: hypothetical protein LUG45_05350 [Clostridiales bacterium]|nr:hypothetical protein [Clostridiales bacterium]